MELRLFITCFPHLWTARWFRRKFVSFDTLMFQKTKSILNQFAILHCDMMSATRGCKTSWLSWWSKEVLEMYICWFLSCRVLRRTHWSNQCSRNCSKMLQDSNFVERRAEGEPKAILVQESKARQQLWLLNLLEMIFQAEIFLYTSGLDEYRVSSGFTG